MGERRTESGPSCLLEATAIAAAAETLLTRTERGWQEVSATYARESKVRGGGRAWTLRCVVRVDRGRVYSSATLWSGDPEARSTGKARAPSPALLAFVASTQRRLRAMGLAGRFQPSGGSHWPAQFSKWGGTGSEEVRRAVERLERVEQCMGARAAAPGR